MNQGQFYHYLKTSRSLRKSTIGEHLNNLKHFEEWAKHQNKPINDFTYNDLLVYVKHLKARSLNNHTINLRVNNIRKYYECLKENGEIKINPATRLNIKGSTRKIIQDPFKQTELEQLYYDYENYRTSHQRKDTKDLKYKMVLGLMIWQGIHSGELQKLETKHVNLQQCNIYLPATTRSNERTLPLGTTQILPLYQYLQSLPKDQVYLLNNTGHDLVRRLIDQLKKVNRRVQNARHIRGSVILNWLKIHNKRQVQYMAGHKWISSTEHYEIQELEELTGLLEKHHPLR